VADETRAPTINLGREVVLIEPPSLFALAASRTEGEKKAQGMSGDLAYGAAALRMCWPDKVAWPVLHRPRPWRIGQSVADYGNAIWEELRKGLRETVSFQDQRDACYEALVYALGSLLTQAEVDAARDFSEAQEE